MSSGVRYLADFGSSKRYRLKKLIYNVYGFLRSLRHFDVLKASVDSIFDEEVLDNEFHLRMSGDWLLFMQNEDGGYSRKFSLIHGKDKSYIETTGYIIPSMWRLGEFLKEEKYICSAIKAGNWLLKVQNEDGSFSEIDNNEPMAFDTGQCLAGLNFLYEKTGDERYLKAAKKASYWLAFSQERNGSWIKVAYNKEPHTYYSKVAAAMLKFGFMTEDEKIKAAAFKNIEWILKNQKESGFFKYSSFLEGIPPYLHTLMYVLEGLLDVYELTKDEDVLKAVLKNANRFKEVNLNRDLILCSQYDETFSCVNRERCIPGLCQWAVVALRLYEITKDKDFRTCAMNTIFYLKAKQLKFSKMKGGFSASIPFWGKYGGFDFVNWTNKYFIDALLLYSDDNFEVIEEQESFVGTAFNISSRVVSDNLSYVGRKYVEELRKILPTNKTLKVLDVGCGKGAIISAVKKYFPNIEFYGIDPVFSGKNILKGSVYRIPFKDNFFDVVMAFEVLQHTYVDIALREISRVLKRNGKLIIGERNPCSVLGILKPILELRGYWMYPFDSPFRAASNI